MEQEAEELHNLYSLPNTMRIIRWMGLEGHVACIQIKKFRAFWIVKLERKKPPARPKHRQEDMDLRETRLQCKLDSTVSELGF
jgi:hypothetical protein